MRMWLSGRASPCQGEGREFESRHPLHYYHQISRTFDVWYGDFLICGCSSVVEPQPSKLVARVRFPSPAPYASLAQLDRASGYGPEGLGFESSMTRQYDIILCNCNDCEGLFFICYESFYDDIKLENFCADYSSNFCYVKIYI